MKIKSLKSIRQFKNKTVLLRVDFNVPIEGGKIRDDFKIKATFETLKFLSNQGAKIILISHLANPKGGFDPKLSLATVARHLRKISNLPITFSTSLDLERIGKLKNKLVAGQILFLENIRFHAGELNNDLDFAQNLASLADIYVNDAFAVSHREQASVSGVQKFLPTYAGLLLKKELEAMERIFQAKKPFLILMGGVKISTKAPLIKSLYSKADNILLGGALANSFFKFSGLEIGRSFVDDDSHDIIKKLLANKIIKKKIILPVDVVVQRGDCLLAKRVDDVKKNETILDIGPETVSLYASYIKKAQTLVWNGPMGKFEEERFRQGTLNIARLVASRSSGRAYGVVGGGETIEALEMSNMAEYVDWVSTGGGAMLSYLSKEKMPGFKNIII